MGKPKEKKTVVIAGGGIGGKKGSRNGGMGEVWK